MNVPAEMTISTWCLIVIAICMVALTLDIESTEDGGMNVYFGNFAYHFANQVSLQP